MTVTESMLVVAWVVLFLQALAIGGLIRQVRILAGALPTQLSTRRIATEDGVLQRWTDHERVTVLIFVTSSCKACAALLPRLQDALLEAHLLSRARLLLLVDGNEAPEGAAGLEVKLNSVHEFTALDVQLTPFAVVVDQQGAVVDTRPVGGARELKQILDTARDAWQEVPPSSAVLNGEHDPASTKEPDYVND